MSSSLNSIDDLPELAEGVQVFFRGDGPLAASFSGHYVEREEQQVIATNIARIAQYGGRLVAEAGTGTGKTLAYLVPALASGLKVLVSTGTKNLQEQIIEHELPLIERASGKSFDVVVMKGRSNYLCEARLERATAQRSLRGIINNSDLEAVLAWRHITQSGDRAELTQLADDSPLWPELSATTEQCAGRRCEHYERCWVTRLRQRAQESALVIVNHHLFFADLALKKRRGDSSLGVLPNSDLIIFDEAHEIDDIAAQHFGMRVSDGRFAELGRDLQRALPVDASETKRLLQRSTEIELRAKQLFESLPQGNGRRALNKHDLNPLSIDLYSQVHDLLLQVEADLHSMTFEEASLLARRVQSLGNELSFVLGLPQRRGIGTEAVDILGDAASSVWGEDGFQEEGEIEKLPYVRYSERSGRRRVVAAEPLDVAPLLHQSFKHLNAVFISATLAVDQKFEHFRRRIGLDETEEVLVHSPFDFQEQARLYLADDLPNPTHSDYASAAAHRACDLIEASSGGALVLCTSYRMLERLKDQLRDTLSQKLWVQGSGPKSYLLDSFRKDGNGVLLATMSFWRGVDIPGRALRLVIIDRLPFASPGDPVVAARLEHLTRQGRSAFGTYQLPQAALMLRQGFGRLIRSETDRGLVAVLDRRIIDKSYGKTLLRSLPPCAQLRDLEQACAFLRTISEDDRPTDPPLSNP